MTERSSLKTIRQTGRCRFAPPTMLRIALTHQGGFTLVELLLGVSILTVLVTGMSSGVFRAFRDVDFQRSGLNSLDESRRVIQYITRDLQVATGTNLIDGASQVATVSITSKDPQTGVTHNTVYSLSGQNLVRTVDGVAVNVGRNITAIGFSRSGVLFSVSLTSTTDGNTASAVNSTWNVYQRIAP